MTPLIAGIIGSFVGGTIGTIGMALPANSKRSDQCATCPRPTVVTRYIGAGAKTRRSPSELTDALRESNRRVEVIGRRPRKEAK